MPGRLEGRSAVIAGGGGGRASASGTDGEIGLLDVLRRGERRS